MPEDRYLKKPYTMVRAFRFTAANSGSGVAWLLKYVAGVRPIKDGDVAVVDPAGKLTVMTGPEFDAAYGPLPPPEATP